MKDLMTPRYEVIANYPLSIWQVGTIITLSELDNSDNTLYFKTTDSAFGDWYWYEDELNKYPHLFRPLAWYEKRDIKDMPEYVKDNFKGNIVIKVHKYMEGILDRFFVSEANKHTEYLSHLACYLPATQSEYEAYINSKI